MKTDKIRDKDYLRFVSSQPCLVTGRTDGVQACHFRLGTGAGLSQKPEDCFVLPLHHTEHSDQHMNGERSYWRHTVTLNPEILYAFMRDAMKWRYQEWKNGQNI